ncbi:MAG: T9SS type A sorting domain-containing protein [Chloroherpetonaceae bacterium]
MFKKINLLKTCIFLVLLGGSLYASDNSRTGGENGELWQIGNTVSIKWDSQIICSDFVNIYLWDGNETKLKQIGQNIPNINEVFNWVIPASIVPGDFYKIKIVSTSDSKCFIMSENFFSIYKMQLDVDLPTPENNASLFPNPARDFIRISNSQNYQGGGYTITDLLGQEVQRGILVASNISVATLPSGMYFLVLRNGAKQIPMKFIKE